MNLTKLFKLSKMLVKLSETKTDKGVLIADDELAVGVEVFIDTEGELTPAEDGEYLTEDSKIVVKDGKVEDIQMIEDVKKEEVKEEFKNDDIIEEALEEPVALQEDEKDAKIKELETLLEEKEKLVKELEEKVKELEGKLAEPAEQSVKMSKQNVKVNSALKYFNK